MNKLPINEFLAEAFKRNKSAQTHEDVHARAVELICRCWAEDVFIVFTDGLRTNVDQAILYGKGRKSYVYGGKQYGNPKVSRVTNAQPGTSMHNYGLALDFVNCDGFGKNIDWIVGPKWRRAAAIAKELGFTWGGDWRSFYDAPHIEYSRGYTASQIKSGKWPTFKPFTPIQLSVTKPSLGKPPKSSKISTVRKASDKVFRLLSGVYATEKAASDAKDALLAAGVFSYAEFKQFSDGWRLQSGVYHGDGDVEQALKDATAVAQEAIVTGLMGYVTIQGFAA